MSGKEDSVEDVKSRGTNVESAVSRVSESLLGGSAMTLEKRTCRLTKRGLMSPRILRRCKEASENQNVFLLSDFNKIHEK